MRVKSHELSNRHKLGRIHKLLRNLTAGNLNSRAQSALEYMMIIALTMGIILPTSYLFFRYSSESNVQILNSQINQIGKDIIDTSENVYFSGAGSKIVLTVNMPESVVDIYIIDNRELVFNVTTSIGQVETVFFSDIKITSSSCQNEVCSLREISGIGLKKIKLESLSSGNQVLISKFQ